MYNLGRYQERLKMPTSIMAYIISIAAFLNGSDIIRTEDL